MQFVKIIQSDNIIFETKANFLKQTYSNRCYIYGANGKQLLNIPIQKSNGKKLIKHIKIDYNENWQTNHLKSLRSAYRSSPFFEYYIDDLLVIFNKKELYLFDLNLNIFNIIIELLPVKVNYKLTNKYIKEVENDYRYLVNSKNKEVYNLPKYTQVFSDKNGFLENLSILDLLFNEGPNALLYLEKLVK